MIARLDDIAVAADTHPTVWGMDPVTLHDYFWAARGVCVVRPGETTRIPDGAELFLLTDARTLAIFRLRAMLDTLCWTRPSVLFVRLKGSQDASYREAVIADEDGRLLGLKRSYGGAAPRLAKVALTTNREIAHRWQSAHDPRTAWRSLWHETRPNRRETAVTTGRVYDRLDRNRVAQFVTDLVQHWKDPSATIAGIKEVSPGVWAPQSTRVNPATRFIGRVWLGAGRAIEGGKSVLGPSALWDDPETRPPVQTVRWQEIEPTDALAMTTRTAHHAAAHHAPSSAQATCKRAFDILFSLVALLLTLPIYPLVMLAIWIEDGRPFFFGHKRETTGGREFDCLKFRSMSKDAEQIKTQLQQQNQADGPQFYIADDPRLTRVGRIIRKLNIDELPQFINVLKGDMSVVGPRPSPHKENQYCPAWREARLSVRPGITGLWQVQRTRRAGADFQEWIRYDIEYVQTAGFGMDLLIIFKTFRVMIGW